MPAPNADYGRVIWDSELRRWHTVMVTERVLRSWETHELAVKYGEACGLEMLPHHCTMVCDHPLDLLPPIGRSET